jgi:protein-S-isoprenylcysteine O-methyltransferase Ste14
MPQRIPSRVTGGKMIAWVSFIFLIVLILVFTGLYIRSVSPARLEPRLGEQVYAHCGKVRAASIIILVLVMVNYVICDLFPLPVPKFQSFSWPYFVSVILAILISVPTTYMVFVGMRDAGDEAIQPDKDSEMFKGIYDKIRHPQTWEYGYFFAISLLLNNPFLLIFSLIWLPLMYLMMRAEERDLLIRFGKEYEDYMQQTGRLLPKRK